MNARYRLSSYITEAWAEAVYERRDEGGFVGRIPSCPGVVAMGPSLFECEAELRATLEDWIVVGFRMHQPMPVVAGIDLNCEPSLLPLDAV